MSTYTATRTRNFGTDDKRDAFFARYGVTSYAEAGRAIAAAQPTRQEATVNDNSTDRATRETVEKMVALAKEVTPQVTEDQIFKFAATNSADVVHARLTWLEDMAWKNRAAAREAEQERQAYEGKMQRDEAKPLKKRDRQPNGQNTRNEVPAGRYAVRNDEGVVKFYKVDRPTEGRWKGYTFVAAQASDDLHPIRGRQAREAVLASIVKAGVEASMALYGRELGKCGHCGRTLTDEESRAYGIGPVCRGKMGF